MHEQHRHRGKQCMRFLHGDVAVDPGVTFYVCVCSLACYYRIEFIHLLPLFTADPMGAIVGRNLKTPKLCGGPKSVGGTLAVWVTAFWTLYEPDITNRVVGATLIAIIELFAGDYDNPAIGAFLLARAIGHT